MSPADVEAYREVKRAYTELRDLYAIPEGIIKSIVCALREEDPETAPSRFRQYPSGDWEAWYLLDRLAVLTAIIMDLSLRTKEIYGKADGIVQALTVASGHFLPGQGGQEGSDHQPAAGG